MNHKNNKPLLQKIPTIQDPFVDKITLIYLLNEIYNLSSHNQNKNNFSLGVDAPAGYGKTHIAYLIHCILTYFYNKDVMDKDQSLSNFYHKNINDLKYIEDNTTKISCVKKFYSIYIPINQIDYIDAQSGILAIIFNRIAQIYSQYDHHEKETYELIKKTSLSVAKFVGNETKAKKFIDLFKEINKNFKSYEETIESTKKTMNNDYMRIIKKIKKINTQITQMNHCIIVILDNMDKCKLEYSLTVLDCIKYLYEVPCLSFITFLDFEFLETLHEGVYSKSISLNHYYNTYFTDTKKMYLKSREDFLNEYITYNHIDINNNNNKTFIDNIIEINKIYRLSLKEIEKSLIKLNKLVTQNPFLLNFNFSSRDGEIYLDILSLLYNMIVILIHDIKGFNKLLIDEVDKTQENKTHPYILLVYSKFRDLFTENKKITDIFQDIDIYDGDFPKGFSLKNINQVNIEINDQFVFVLKSHKIIFNIERSKFSFAHLFNSNDLLYHNHSDLLNFTIRDYLRYKISQI